MPSAVAHGANAPTLALAVAEAALVAAAALDGKRRRLHADLALGRLGAAGRVARALPLRALVAPPSRAGALCSAPQISLLSPLASVTR